MRFLLAIVLAISFSVAAGFDIATFGPRVDLKGKFFGATGERVFPCI
jgi:hypothetical protein